MDMLKKIFPLSWKFQGDVKNLIIGLLIYFGGGLVLNIVLVCTVIGALLVPIAGLYEFVGAVILILIYAKVIKDEPAAEVEASAEEAKDDSTEE